MPVIVTIALHCLIVDQLALADSAVAWGLGFNGQLGNGTTEYSYAVPIAVNGLSSGINAIAAGTKHSLAIQNGAALAWGTGGTLGNGSAAGSSVPVAVSGLGNGVTAVAGGDSFSLAIQNGAAVAWGGNFNGELGNGSNTNSLVPVGVQGLSSGVTAIAAGAYGHSLAIQNGAAMAWGDNINGELGNGSTTDSNIPVAVVGLGSGVSSIAAGKSFSFAIQNGGLKAWGGDFNGALGTGLSADSNVPVAVNGLTSGVTAIAAGNGQGLAIQNGDVFAWGNNYHGQVGNGSTNNSPLPVKVLDLGVDLVAVAAGFESSYALAADGSLWVWGGNEYGELGLGTFGAFNYTTPQQMVPPSGYVFTSIDAGALGYHAIATLAAVPEPSSLTLIAVVGVTMRRRK